MAASNELKDLLMAVNWIPVRRSKRKPVGCLKRAFTGPTQLRLR